VSDEPSPVISEAPPPRHRGWLTIGFVAAILVYGVGYLIWYLGTPLGQAPQLDGAENLALAGQIAHGTLPHESFYRAMLYPAVLAVPLKLGLPGESLPAFAAIFGLLCHFAITLGVARLAARLWAGPNEKQAALLAAALWGFNPVALFYAVDVLDTVPSLALFVWGLVWYARPGTRKVDSIVGGVFLGLAVAARPHFLPVVFMATAVRALLAGRRKAQYADMSACFSALAVLLVVGGVDARWGGEFHLMPTQGAYNFYAANLPGANGRYYTQKVLFAEITPGENPARKEAEALYAQATQTPPPHSMAEMNAYWRAQAWANITTNPMAWLKLMAKKTYYLLNDFDQYNNQTYAWHQAESPWLKWNYLGWGILFVMAVGAVPLAWRRVHSEETIRPKLLGLLLVFCTYAAGVLLYYASGRFRLPLMALLCVPAAGWAANLPMEKKKKGLCLGAMLLPVMLTFSNLFAAHDTSTFIQDELLSANAAAQTGNDELAEKYAQQALLLDPTRPDARRIALVSYFNLTTTDAKTYDTLRGWQAQLKLLPGLELPDASSNLAAGMAYWKTGDKATALKIWKDGAGRFGPGSMPTKALLTENIFNHQIPQGTPPPDLPLLDYMQRQPGN